ncbi:MAG: 4'-phosphopantetheinyl transferase superfamily protein [Bacteroidales bacterium]|nr:4'-phosphopantetheinyl transferase superfamily protein [Bacteroidales bacterium]MCM1414682.1 4'-phosphopantetheinyl transferase superfamily protein [bacterium]MCM1422371.1 4'-phosphopantetheinyl transferase superfamily protein [bacterium]
MIYTCYADVRCLDNRALFQEKCKLLSPYRQQKIALLRHEKDKNRSLAAGLLLNHALGIFGLQEKSMEYEIGEWGKPAMKYHPELHFSLSHSGDYAICSIGDKPLGNDIELVKDGRIRVADRFFAEEERDWLYDTEEEAEKNRRMFRLWTMKESFIKVTGRGMSLPLSDFAIHVDGASGRVRVRHSFDGNYYAMREYREIEGYCTAVCCQGKEDMAYSMIPVELY